MAEPAPRRLAVFDMDLTITSKPSWLPWLAHYVRSEAPARAVLAPLMLFPALAFKLGFIDRKGLKQATQWLMMGNPPRDKVERAARRFAERFGAGHELPAALAEIAARRAQGDLLVMATASCGYYARFLAARWGFDLLVATANRWDGERLSPRIVGENCYGDAKLRMLLAAIPGGHPHAAFFSDHVTDLPCLLWADEPVAANPSAALRAEARARGWRIADWAAPAAPATPG